MGIKDITDSVKKALEIANELKNIELKEAILELKEKILALREENGILKEELSKKEKYNMEYQDNCYWNIRNDGTKDGPYCSVCWDKEHKAIRLSKTLNETLYACGNCNNQFFTRNVY